MVLVRGPGSVGVMSSGAFIICESYPGYRNHIRLRHPSDPLKPSGGLRATALCGFQFVQGWDKPDVKLTLRYSDSMKTENGIRYCAECVRLYQQAVAGKRCGSCGQDCTTCVSSRAAHGGGA